MRITIIYSTPTRRAVKQDLGKADAETAIVAQEVYKALLEKKQQPSLFPVTEDSIHTLISIEADCIFNLIEWTGEDMRLSVKAFDFLEERNLPFTGADRRSYFLSADKVLMKRAFDKKQIPSPKYQIFYTGDEHIRRFKYPVIVKLAHEHSSIGLTRDAIVESIHLLKNKIKERISTHNQPVLVEEFITGREFQVSVLEKNGKPWILPIEEVSYKTALPTSMLTYESKWIQNHPDHDSFNVSFAKLDKDLRSKIEKLVSDAYQNLRLNGYSRFDIRFYNTSPLILEINSNPNLYDPEEEGMELVYHKAGLSFSDYIWLIVQSAVKKN